MAGKVLSVASESVPLIKTGGLADVVGALPAALAVEGWEMKVMLPAYRPLRHHLAAMIEVWYEGDLFGGEARVYEGQVEGLHLLLLDAPHLYDRPNGPYNHQGCDWPDNPQRFAALGWMAAKLARTGIDGWFPDVLHAHDWQAALAPAYLAWSGRREIATVLTIHNIAFQGRADAGLLAALRLPAHEFYPGSLEYYGAISTLKAGMVTADRVTTVSAGYAAELMRPEVGMGLQGVLAERAADVVGIMNGVDETLWSPERADFPYSVKNLKNKALNREALCQEFGLTVPGPLAIVVSRLTSQKGLDLLPVVVPDFVAAGGGLIVLGTGDAELEAKIRLLEAVHPGRVAVRIGYDEALSHRLFAGADAVLVPSRFEPCGLTQLYGLRFGTIPVVAAVGGLGDTVIDASPAALSAGVATGISFHPTDALAFAPALRRLIKLYLQPRLWAQIQRNAMRHPVGWQVSARAYAELYESIRR
jgi:starch synthase